MKKNKKVIAIILVALIIIYIAYAVFLLIVHPTETYIVKQGTLAKEDEAIGYIIREEVVIKDENNENEIYAIASENQKVAVNDAIFRYYSDNEKEITKKINELDYKIQTLLEHEKNEPSADIKAIENQIEGKIEYLNKLNNYQEITEYKKSIDELISKKIKFIGEVTENSEIKKLVKERASYENQLKNGSEYQRTDMSGVVSYRVDGMENVLSVDKFDLITQEYLDELNLKTGQIISTSTSSGKVINNFKCYIAVTMNSKEAMEAKIGNSVQIRTSNKEVNEAKIVKINEENEKRTIIFQINKVTDDLINHRKIAIDVIWWDVSGLKVPNQALIEENGLFYVMRNKAGVQSKLLVKIKKQTEKFSIISEYSSEELQELGYDEKEIKNYKKIKNYDEIMMNM